MSERCVYVFGDRPPPVDGDQMATGFEGADGVAEELVQVSVVEVVAEFGKQHKVEAAGGPGVWDS